MRALAKYITVPNMREICTGTGMIMSTTACKKDPSCTRNLQAVL